MKVNAFTSSDIKSLPGLQPDGWGDITPSYEYYIRSSFCHPIKIMNDNKMVGIGTTIIHHDVAWLAHIIVHKEYRKRGIGRLITEALVNSLKNTSCETIYLLATHLGAPVYEKVGFETETEYLFFKDIKVNENIEMSGNIKSYDDQLNEQVAAIDKMTSGEDRMFHLEEHLPNGFVYNENGTVEGFYLPSFGDGLILAINSRAGLALAKFHLRTNERLVFPKDNTTVISYLYDKGFKEITTGKRMRLGKKRDVVFENIYNRIGGNLG